MMPKYYLLMKSKTLFIRKEKTYEANVRYLYVANSLQNVKGRYTQQNLAYWLLIAIDSKFK